MSERTCFDTPGQRRTLIHMVYTLRGMDEFGRLVDIPVEFCWRCGCMVALTLVSFAEHVDRAHPVPPEPEPEQLGPEPRHALD